MTQNKNRILVVDDEGDIQIVLRRILEEAGYEVETAYESEEALEKLGQSRFDLALLDIMMPRVSGIDVLKKINVNWPDTGVVMVTAVVEANTVIEAMKLGAYDYITKPFSANDVVLKVRNALTNKAYDREHERRQEELEKQVSEQAERLQQQFSDMVETLAREHQLLYKLADSKKGGRKVLSKLPEELQEPMSSVEDFRDALLKILKRS